VTGPASIGVDAVNVHKGDALAGRLVRTARGAEFTYGPDYVAAHAGQPQAGVSFRMPVRPEAFAVQGDSLHPFFAGLLPEGRRLDVLVTKAKTSRDDLFTLLVEAGRETIGDVWISGDEEQAGAPEPMLDLGDLKSCSFEELLSGRGLLDNAASIPGVQPKVSATRLSLPVGKRENGLQFILKLAPPTFPRLVQNEHFFMGMARLAGLKVPTTVVVEDRDGVRALLVARFDRRQDRVSKDSEGAPAVERLHCEDACQLLDRYPADKYRITAEELSQALEVCSAPMVERLRLIELLVYSYLIGNGDLHAKNVSVLTEGGRVRLSPAYDLLSTHPYGDDTQALEMNGKKAGLRRAHFISFAGECGVARRAVERSIDRIRGVVENGEAVLEEIGFGERVETKLRRVIRRRVAELGT
jgi:serine/threonine-protein kinase HipA